MTPSVINEKSDDTDSDEEPVQACLQTSLDAPTWIMSLTESDSAATYQSANEDDSGSYRLTIFLLSRNILF